MPSCGSRCATRIMPGRPPRLACRHCVNASLPTSGVPACTAFGSAIKMPSALRSVLLEEEVAPVRKSAKRLWEAATSPSPQPRPVKKRGAPAAAAAAPLEAPRVSSLASARLDVNFVAGGADAERASRRALKRARRSARKALEAAAFAETEPATCTSMTPEVLCASPNVAAPAVRRALSEREREKRAAKKARKKTLKAAAAAFIYPAPTTPTFTVSIPWLPSMPALSLEQEDALAAVLLPGSKAEWNSRRTPTLIEGELPHRRAAIIAACSATGVDFCRARALREALLLSACAYKVNQSRSPEDHARILAAATRLEDAVGEFLTRHGVLFHTQAQQQAQQLAAQRRGLPFPTQTPDFLVDSRCKLLVNGVRVRWLEVKNFIGIARGGLKTWSPSIKVFGKVSANCSRAWHVAAW